MISHAIKILVLCTFLYALFHLGRKDKNHLVVLAILLVCTLTEAINIIIQWLDFIYPLHYPISILVHNSLWLFLLSRNSKARKAGTAALFLGIVVFFIDNNYILKTGHFCYYTFIAGALSYVLLFVLECIRKLDQEDILFFTADTFLLLCAPLLFFINLGLMFSFNSYTVTNKHIFGMELYGLLNCFVNLSYYLIIILYVYRQKHAPTATLRD